MPREAPARALFLWDYIYEYATLADTTGLARGRTLRHSRSLADFRDRYALHKSDLQLQVAHAACPWIGPCDDNEVQNDWAVATGRWGNAGFTNLHCASFQVLYKHIPLGAARRAAPGISTLKLHRRIAWGRLAQNHVLHGRQYRGRQACRRAQASGAGGVQAG